tara:strand:- start:532 stop:1377 length:846 start_codon:yes stop_codon:yes gene_type:complete
MIIDTHVHFADDKIPNTALFRIEMPEVFKSLTKQYGVESVIHVETRQTLEENYWVLDLAERDKFISGCVGFIDPITNNFNSKLALFKKHSRFKGIRIHTLDYLETDNKELFIENMLSLANSGLALDLHTTHHTLYKLERIIKYLGNLPIIINHIAGPPVMDAMQIHEKWASNLIQIAKYPNVHIKLSALVQMTVEWEKQKYNTVDHKLYKAPSNPEYYKPVIDLVFNQFGENRIIYASNWPQLERVSDYATGLNIVKSYFDKKGSNISSKIFKGNALNFYK